jgi:methylthioribulose-1-phosphate dehydratase
MGEPRSTDESRHRPDPRRLIVDLCGHFYGLGWVSGTGGGVSVREGDRIYVAPSGVQKERLREQDLFELDREGHVIRRPGDPALRISACTPLFLNAYRMRDAGAVLHSHAMAAMLATLVHDRELRVTHLEMMKGIRGVGYHDELVVPIIDNTAHECDLAGSMAEAMERYPDTHAVLVRRHGVYVWGRDWVEAKTHAECYHYLFEAAVRMRELGLNAAERPPQTVARDAAE